MINKKVETVQNGLVIAQERELRRLDQIYKDLMCAELAGDFHLGDSRQLTDKSLLPFDLVS